ncbi:MAG: formyltransferase family protein [Candidatus Woesearchaeota archaeon]
MALTKLHDPAKSGQLRIAGFMSRTGSNLTKIIEHEHRLKMERGMSPFHVPVIFTDNWKSDAAKIGADFGIPVFNYDLEGFCRQRNLPVTDMDARRDFELFCSFVLKPFCCTAAAYAGYMRKATPVFVNAYLGVNVHPADLTLLGADGRPKYRGAHAVRDAIAAGETELRSSTHLVTGAVDCGPVLMVSPSVTVRGNIDYDILDRLAKAFQDALKEKGDWVIFPKTLEYIADGRFARDETGQLYFDGREIHAGLRIDS